MRKIWFSSKVACSMLLRRTALTRSVPKGFSMMMRERSTRSAFPSSSTTSGAAVGGTLR